MNAKFRRRATFVITTLLLAGCAARSGVDRSTAQLVWPLPPDQPRVKWVESYSRRGHYGAQGSDRLKAALLGDDPRAQERMLKPYAITTDSKGRVYVSDTGLGTVWVFDPTTRDVRFIGESGSIRLITPSGLVVDDRDVLYVADANLDRVFAFDQQGRVVLSIGEKDEFYSPGGLALHQGLGRLYVADAGLHRIRVYESLTGRFLFQFGGRGAEPGKFNYPTHIALRGSRLYVTDTMNFRIQVFDLDGRYVSKIGEMGSSLGQFARPKGVGVDAEGNVYVADAAFNNFQIFTAAGELLLFVGHVGTKAGEFWLPAGLHIDREDRVYVVDQYNRRVEVFQYLGEVYLAKTSKETARK